MTEIVTIATPSLGNRSYLATDGSAALVVDPPRDIDRILAAAQARGVAITHVFETHIHNDYLTGGLTLARATGAAYHVNAADAVAFDRVKITDGDLITVGDAMRVRVIATPGHTFTHLAYALEDVPSGAVRAVFTGGSLLHGSTGRPDLLGAEHAATLAAAQHASARRLAATLPGAAELHPTHGFGSFCAATPATPAGAGGATLADEQDGNPVFVAGSDAYVRMLLAGLDDYPAYYARMAPANSAGPAASDLTPPAPASAAEISRRIAAGEWVVNLRARRAFAAGHLPGSLSFESGDNLVANLGWLLPPGTPLTLLGRPGQIAGAQRDLARIGIDQIAGAAGWPLPKSRPAARGLPGGRLRRPGHGPAAAAGDRPGRAPPAGVVGRPYRGRGAHSAAPPARPARRAATWPGLGALPGGLPGQRGRVGAARLGPRRRRHRRRVRERGPGWPPGGRRRELSRVSLGG